MAGFLRLFCGSFFAYLYVFASLEEEPMTTTAEAAELLKQVGYDVHTAFTAANNAHTRLLAAGEYEQAAAFTRTLNELRALRRQYPKPSHLTPPPHPVTVQFGAGKPVPEIRLVSAGGVDSTQPGKQVRSCAPAAAASA
jgi:hypothetical protein